MSASERATALVRQATGMVFAGARADVLRDAVRLESRRMGVNEEAFVDQAASDPDALAALLDRVTVHESYFFRDSAQFAVLRDRVLPELAAAAPGRPLRIWSAGCADGEEAYSLAVTAQDVVPGAHRIIGSDLSQAALERAASATYGNWALRGLSEADRSRYFRAVRGRWVLRPECRRGVVFHRVNLAGEGYPDASLGLADLDLVLCRNVLIYLDASTVAHVVRRLLASLRAGGWLVVGAADPLVGPLAQCEVVETPAGLMYRRVAAQSQVAVPASRPPQPAWRPPVRLAPAGPAPAPALAPDPAATPGPREPCGEVARRFADRAQWADAERACLMGLAEQPEDLDLHVVWALVLLATHRPEEALREARRVVYLEPRHVPGHVILAQVHLVLSNHPRARTALRNARALLADLPDDAVLDGAGVSAGEYRGLVGALAHACGEAAA